MNKKRLTVLALMMALLMVLSLCLFVACNEAEDPDEDTTVTVEPTKGLLISNGDFKVTKQSDKTFPLTPDSWSGAAMYSSGSYPKGVIAGVISLEEAIYNEHKALWNDDGTIYGALKSHYSSDEDAVNNALMIYMPKEGTDEDDYGPTAYGYTSSSFKLGSSKFYKLSVDVLTYDIAGTLDKDGNQEADSEPGARIYISSQAYAEYANINTNGQWETYTFYFESAVSSDTSLTVQLGLGKYNSEYKVGLTSGYAFFDNLALEEIEETEYAENRNAYTANNTSYIKNNQVHTLKVNNGSFDFGTTNVGTSAAASNWKVVTGTDAPTGLGKNGVINVANFAENYTKYANSYYVSTNGTNAELRYPANRLNNVDGAVEKIGIFGDDRIGTNVYMLSQQRMTAQGLQSSKPIVIEKGKFYAISVSVYTYDIHGAGVTLTLSGDGEDISIKGISSNPSHTEFPAGLADEAGATNGGWTTYTFYIHGNEYRDFSYNMTLWLGTGSASDNESYTYDHWESTTKKSDKEYKTYYADGTFSTGWAFFDEVKLAEITETAFNNAGEATGFESTAGYAKVALHTENLFTTFSADFTTFVDNATEFEGTTLGTPAGFSIDSLLEKKAEDETLPYIDVTAGVVSIADTTDFSEYGIENPGKPYNITSDNALMIKANSNTYFYYDTASFTIEMNKAYRISFWVKTLNTQSTAGVHAYLLDSEGATLSSFATINTEKTVDDETTSTWTEYTFYVLGHETENKELSLRLAYGAGTRWTSSTLADGVAFIANMSMSAIEHKDFENATANGAVVKSISLGEEATISSSFTNGNFNAVDTAETKWSEESNGILASNDKAGVPENWTLSDTTYKPAGDNGDNKVNSTMSYLDDSNLVAGIIKLEQQDDKNFYNHSAQIAEIFGADIASKFDTLYGDESSASYFDNVDRLGAPYVLALAGLNGNAYSRRFTSKTFSLSAGNNYELKVWVKTIGKATYSIYLTGGTSGKTYFGEATNFVATSEDADWTCYTFYIEVGLTSVSSLKLSLGLGYDESISGELDENAYSQYSTGIVLFDNVTLTSKTTDEEFDAVEQSATSRKISYLSDGFDSANETTESHDELTSPNGWKGAVGTEQSSSNTKGGVVYAPSVPTFTFNEADSKDENYKDIIESMGTVASLFGKTYKYTDYEILQSEIDAVKAQYEGKTDDEIKVILQKTKMYNDMKANYISTTELLSTIDKDGNDIASIIGNNFLVINNIGASAYTYTSSTYSLTKENFYRVSVWVRTYNVTGAGASVEFYLGSANEKDNPFIFKGIGASAENGTTAWTQYTFYVKTLEENVTSASIKLALGEYDADDEAKLSTGYAMFDAIEFEIIDEDAFNNAVAGDFVAVRTVAESSQEGNVEENEEPTTPDNEFNLDSLWWMIPTILLAVATLAVLVVYVVKRFRKPARAKMIENTNNEAIIEKRNKYEDFNE